MIAPGQTLSPLTPPGAAHFIYQPSPVYYVPGIVEEYHVLHTLDYPFPSSQVVHGNLLQLFSPMCSMNPPPLPAGHPRTRSSPTYNATHYTPRSPAIVVGFIYRTYLCLNYAR
ncbi:hypothetical protein J6590_036141 [Homalodisca vitripennis]|nr:hypothetical protein J6590_036141 [Homalodisca vitripennis]